MPASRETVMAALYTLLSGIVGFTTASRRNRSPESIGTAQSPALFVLEHSETYEVRSVALPPIRHLIVSVIIYNDVGPVADAIPSTAINNALDAIDAALQPGSPSMLNSLGGLVDSLIIDGTVEKAPGDKTGKSIAVVPIRITLP